MKKKLLLWTLAALAAGVPGSLAAQPAGDEEAIFAEGAFDTAVAQGQSAAAASQLAWLGGVTLLSSADLVLPADRAAWGSRALFDGKGFLKASDPTKGALFLSYSIRHTLWASAGDPVLAQGYAREKPDPGVPAYRLSEFHLSFDLDKRVFLRAGTQLLDWGAGTVWSPADFVNRKETGPGAALDTRSGKPGLRVHVPFASGNLFLFADASRSFGKDGLPRDLAETGVLAFRTDATVGGWALGVTGAFGRSSDPRLGLTAVGALAGIDLWADAGSVLPLQGRDFSWSASAGAEKTFGQDSEWVLRGEGYWNPQGRGDAALTGADLASFTPLYGGQAYGYAEAVRKKILGPDADGSVSVLANLADRSWQAGAKVATAFPGTIPLTLSVKYNGGSPDREFTLGAGGPAWTLGLTSLLSY